MSHQLLSLAILATLSQLCLCFGGVFELRLRSTVPSTVHVCLKEYQYSIQRDGRCVLGRTNATLIPDETRLLRIPFPGLWPENISLIVDALNGNQVRVGGVAWRGSVAGGADWISSTSSFPSSVGFSGSPSDLLVHYRFVCQDSFFGAQCKIMCRATDNLSGHFSCDGQGRKVCLTGWNGTNCDIPVCEGGCGSGSCVAPGDCRCPFGFEGEDCNKCMPRRDCVHGICQDNKPGTCACLPGWTGPYCDQDLHYCTRHSPCQNGGTCTNGRLVGKRQKRSSEFTCTCPNGFGGRNCQLSLTDHLCENGQVCYNGGTCTKGVNGSSGCQCPSGYKGARCDVAAGEARKQPSADPCERNPCSNGGSCISRGSVPLCLCAPCFSGSDCSNMDEKCLWQRSNSTLLTSLETTDHKTSSSAVPFVVVFCLLALVLSLVLLALCLIYRKMTSLMRDPSAQNAANERRRQRDGQDQVYKICMDESTSCTDPPPPYYQRYLAPRKYSTPTGASRDLVDSAAYADIEQYATIVLPKSKSEQSKCDVVVV